MRLYGLIGWPLGHSFSEAYFTQKFQQLGIEARYQHFELAEIADCRTIFARENIWGLNVTIPYKTAILPFLDSLDPLAAAVGAVNTIAFVQGKRIGYNTDVWGFAQSLARLQARVGKHTAKSALILGTGGAAKAVYFALQNAGFQELRFVSRAPATTQIYAYTDLPRLDLAAWDLVVQASPVGMYPALNSCPDFPYHKLTARHLAIDLVYNPAETLFLQRCKTQGATTQNGLEMLHLQAERAWEIWQKQTFLGLDGLG